MTEEEIKNDPAYLRGRIEGLEAILDLLIDTMPIPALRYLRHRLKFDIDHVIKTRDADPVHLDWTMKESSWYPPDRKPPVTLHAEGFLEFAGTWHDQIDGVIEQKKEDGGYSILAATAQATKQDADMQAYLDGERDEF